MKEWYPSDHVHLDQPPQSWLSSLLSSKEDISSGGHGQGASPAMTSISNIY
jgi:hypothetical protein